MIQKRIAGFIFSTAVASLISTLGVVPEAFALTTLKQVQVSNGSQIDLLFDGKVSRNQVHTDFINDTIQISLSDSAVYPAKISAVNGGSVTKVFAYQYAPKLVRCRLSVKGNAESYKDLLQISPNGRTLTIRVGEISAQAPVAPPVQKASAPSVAAETDPVGDKALLEKVLKSGNSAGNSEVPVKAAAPVVMKAPANPEVSDHPENLGRAEKERPLAGGKALPSPLFAFGKLIIVLGLFGIVAVLAKRVIDRRGVQANSGVMGALGRLAQSKLGKSAKMIEVLSTHYLGPKKSIAVVRVANRTLVLGVTNEAINLITQLSAADASAELIEEELPSLDAENAGGGIFSHLLKTESARPKSVNVPVAQAAAPSPALRGYAAQMESAPSATTDPIAAEIAPQTGVRSQIRSRLEGLKPL